MTQNPINQLLLRYQQDGEPEALGALFDAVAPSLLRVARRLARDDAAADDLVQETFLAVVTKVSDWDATRPAGPWLMGILAYRAQTAQRRAARRVEPDRVQVPVTPEPSQGAETAEVDAAVRTALKALSAQDRAVVVARIFEGLSGQELASRFGLTTGGARTRLHRALARLRGSLPAGISLGGLGVLGASSKAQLRRLAPIRDRVISEGSSGAVPSAAPAPAAAAVGLGVAGVELGRYLLGAAVLSGLVGAWYLSSGRDVPALSGEEKLDQVVQLDGIQAVDVAGVAVESARAATLQVAGAGNGERTAVAAAPELAELESVATESEPVVLAGAKFMGRVVDLSGNPIAGAAVKAWHGVSQADAPDRITESAPDGSFQIDHLGPSFQIGASKDGYAIVSGFSGTLKDGEEVTGLEVVLDRAERMRGRIVNEDGQALVGVQVEIRPDRSTMNSRLRTPYESVTVLRRPWCTEQTDSLGYFDIGPVPSGKTRLNFELAPYLRTYKDLEAGLTEHKVELTRGLSISGVVRDAAGRPAVGARVRFEPYWGNIHTVTNEVLVGDTGQFTVQGFVATGRWGSDGEPYLIVESEGMAIEIVQPITPTKGATGPPVVVDLEPEAILEGQLLHTNGTPATGVSLWVEGQREMIPSADFGVRPTWEFAADINKVSTDSNGIFRFAHLYAGPYQLHVVDPDDPQRDAEHEVTAGGSPLELVLDLAAMDKVVLAGTVNDAFTGEPVTSFIVTPMVDGSGFQRKTTSERGEFEVSGLPPGEIKVDVVAEGYARWRQPAADYDLGIHHLDVRLVPSTSLPFRVVDENGAPRGRASLEVRTMEGELLSMPTGPQSHSTTLTTAPGARGVLFALPKEPLNILVSSDNSTARFLVDLSLPVDGEYEFVLPTAPPLATGPVHLIVVTLPPAAAAELEAQFANPNLRPSLRASLPDPSSIFPTVPVTLVMTKRSGDQSATIRITPDGKGQFRIEEELVQQTGTSFRTGHSSSTTFTIPSPSASMKLVVGVWDVVTMVGGVEVGKRTIEVTESEPQESSASVTPIVIPI